MQVPPEATEFIRNIFAEANDAATRMLSRAPNVHEPSLDQAIISKLDEFASPVQVTKDLVIRIDTHFLGGRRMWSNWEVADLGVLVVFRVRGKIFRTKVALLQSKRLYPKEENLATPPSLEAYREGFGRIYPEQEDYELSIKARVFEFDETCKYVALRKGDAQEIAIKAYESDQKMPVHYMFYNPQQLPWTVEVPLTSTAAFENQIGVSIISSDDLRKGIGNLAKNQSPSYKDLKDAASFNEEGLLGRRLENFIADRIVGCHEGFRTDNPEDRPLQRLFYERSGPISAAIAITIDMPGD